MRSNTWIGCLICVLAALPGIAIGGVAAFIYRGMAGHPGIWIFDVVGFTAPGRIFDWIMVTAVAAVLHGGIGGAIAVIVTSLVYQGPRITKISFITGALYSAIVVFALVVEGILRGPDLDTVESIFQVLGFWIGLMFTAITRSKPETVAEPA